MKLLFVGPYPPPHGGVSVHVRNAHSILSQAGVPCGVLNLKGRPPLFFRELLRHVVNDWKLHVHTNGHNPKSWLVALGCGLAGQVGAGGVLTLHSGLLPDYLRTAPPRIRATARLACLLYERVVCVNEEIEETLRSIGIPEQQLMIMPAFLPAPVPDTPVPPRAYKWMTSHDPVISTTLSFRPEYGFDLLLSVFNRLRVKFPRLGCLVMGGGGEVDAAEDRIRTLGLSDHVFLAGDLDHDLCLRLMSGSDLFVRPTFRDGDANSVREALAMGLPVVASRVGNRPEGVLLFEPGDEEGLAASIERGLRVRAINPNPKPVDDYVGRLMALYT